MRAFDTAWARRTLTLTRFSLETLIRYLDRLDHRIDITVTHVRPNDRRDQ